MPEIHGERRARVAHALATRDADAALITNLVNVRYLSGLASSNAAVLIGADGSAVLATDGRYTTAAQAVAPDIELVTERAVAAALAKRAVEAGAMRLGVEEHNVTLALAGAIEEAAGAATLVHLNKAVEEFRISKDDAELAALRQACAISCRALEDLFAAGGFSGRTEQAVARDLEARMYEYGADGIAFETIVAAGSNSAVPHHRPTGRTIAAGDLLKIDFGAQYQGYHADCTRTAVIGAEPEGWQREIYDLVAAAQEAGRDALAVGADCIKVDTASRTVIADAGYKDRFTHGTGHGVGLEVHEAPTLGYSATGTLAARTAVTVEPGVYLPGRGGVRIEDTLVVGDGGPELLTTTTKDLLVLDA